MLVKFDFKQLYINGRLSILGTPNLYMLWNNWMFRLYQKYTKKKKR